jgi:CBS domain-containing protein
MSLQGLEQTLDRSVEQAVHAAASKTKELTQTLQGFLERQPRQGAAAAPTVSSIMVEDVRTCRENDSLDAAARLMWDHDCGSAVVLNEQDLLAGIITDRDICMAGYLKGLPLASVRVADVMTRSVQTCRAEQSMTAVAALMGHHQIHRVVVVDGHGHPIGIVAIADVVRHAHLLGTPLAQDLTYQLLRAICQPRPRQAGQSSSDQAAAE